MRYVNCVIFAILAVFYCSAAIAEPVPSAIQARYSAMVKDLEKCDLKAFDAFFAADYTSVDPSGKTSNRSEYLAGIHELMKGAMKSTIKLSFKEVRTHNGIVDVSFDCVGKIFSAAGITTFHEIGVDSWKKAAKDWTTLKTVDKVMDVSVTKTKSK
jgi:hypothetical protein